MEVGRVGRVWATWRPFRRKIQGIVDVTILDVANVDYGDRDRHNSHRMGSWLPDIRDSNDWTPSHTRNVACVDRHDNRKAMIFSSNLRTKFHHVLSTIIAWSRRVKLKVLHGKLMKEFIQQMLNAKPHFSRLLVERRIFNGQFQLDFDHSP